MLKNFLIKVFTSLMFRTNFAQRLSILEKNQKIFTNYLLDNSFILNSYSKLLSCLEVKSPQTEEIIRYGPIGDGGYLLVNKFEQINKVVSLGVGQNIDIELYFANLGKEILLFDGTITSLPRSHKKFEFFNSNVYGTIPTTPNSSTFILVNDIFSSHLQSSAKDFDKEFLKSEILFFIDIEGSEYDLIMNLEKSNLEVCQQITIEFHDIFKQITQKNAVIFDALTKLRETHELISVHGNNFGASFLVNGMDYPDVLETTWLRKDLSTFVKSKNNFNPILNKPNNPLARELALEW
jgi:hypothetical protein